MAHRTAGEADLRHLSLADRQVLLALQGVLHHLLIQPPVRLGPEAVDCGALATVQQPILDAGLVGGLPHLASQSVQLPDQMALAGAAYGGVTGHVTHRIQVDGKADGFHPQPGGGKGCLDAGMARANDGDIILSRVKFSHIRGVLMA